MPNTSRDMPGLKALANGYFAVRFHLEGLETEAARAAEFRRAWQLRTDIAAIPDRETWRSRI